MILSIFTFQTIGIFITTVLITLLCRSLVTRIKNYRKNFNRKVGESLLTESDQINILLNNLPNSIYIKDSNYKYILVNNSFVKLLKLNKTDELIGKSDADFYEQETCNRYFSEDEKVLSGAIPILERKQESIKNGIIKITLTTKIPIRNKMGKIIGLIGTIQDITEKEKNAETLFEKNQLLEKEKTLFKALMDNMPDTIYIKDAECKFLDGNPEQVKALKATDYSDMIGKTDFDFYPRDIAEIYNRDDRQILESGIPVINKEEIGFDVEGNILIKSTTKVPFRNENGKIIGLVGIGRDITSQKEIEEKLREQAQNLQEINVLLEERQEEIHQQTEEMGLQNKFLEDERNLLRTLIDNIPDYIYLKNSSSQFITVNKKMLALFKTDNLDEIIGKTDADLLHKDFAENLLRDDLQVLKTGSPIYTKEEPGLDLEGIYIQLLTSKIPLKNTFGEITGLIGIARDITSLKKIEIQLIEQANYLKEANVLLEERQEEIQQQSYELSQQNHILENEKNLLRTLIDTLPDVIYIKDTQSRFVEANARLINVMKAISFNEIDGKSDFDYYPKKIAQQFYDDEQLVIKSGKPLLNKEEVGFDENGKELIVSTTKVPYYNQNGQILGIVGIGRDISDLKKTQEILQKQADDLAKVNDLLEERQVQVEKQSEYLNEQNKSLEKEKKLLRTLIDNMPDYIYVKDKESKFLTVNKRLLEVMHKKNLNEVIGKTDFELSPSKDAAEQYFKDEQKILTTGKAIINKEEIGFDESDREKIISTSKVPFYDSEGKIAGLVGIGRDITKQKNAEKQLREQAENLQEINIILEERQEKIQEQSEELNKHTQSLKKANTQLELLNATKNKFFSIIAHDLKNPFQAIFGFSELLLRNFKDFEDNQKMELLGMIKLSSESAYNLLENLLQWARTQTDRIKYNPVPIRLSDLIQQNIELAAASTENKQISLLTQIDCNTDVYADKNMINLVIRNLLSNAIKFTSHEGVITLTCFEKDKNEVAISISDSGVGISEENIKKLFRIEEYFSTSGTSGESGTGLGLIICKEFIEKNKGEITIESELEIGTTFTFTLPKYLPK